MSVFLVLALVSQLVLWCVIAWSRIQLSVGSWLSSSSSSSYYYYYQKATTAAAGWLESGSECRCVRRAEIEEAPDVGKWGPLELPMFRQ